MKKILVAFVVFMLIGCVFRTPVDYSLSNTEKLFIQNIFIPDYSIDSFKVEVYKYVRGTEEWGKYDYMVYTYTTRDEASIDVNVLQGKADSLANFIADFTKNRNMPLAYFSLYYVYKRRTYVSERKIGNRRKTYREKRETARTFDYEIDKENRPVLMMSSTATF